MFVSFTTLRLLKMLEFFIFVALAIRMFVVSMHGYKAVVESCRINTTDCFDCLDRENFFLNVISLHKWTFKQFYPEIK